MTDATINSAGDVFKDDLIVSEHDSEAEARRAAEREVPSEGSASHKNGDNAMAPVLQFGEVLDAADQLSHDEQEELIGILHRRLAQASRQRLVAEIKEARQEFAEGRCLPMTPGELMREIMK